MRLERPTDKDQFVSATERTVANVIYSSNWLVRELSEALAPFGITLAQHNVLRVLQAADPTRLTCGQIGGHLLEHTPDLTRLLDRLQRDGLIERVRSRHDRRVVEVGLTLAARDLLDKATDPVNSALRRVTRSLSIDERRQLSELLERMRRTEPDIRIT